MNESDDYLWDRSGPADPEIARLEGLMAPLRHDAPLDELRLAGVERARRSRKRVMIVSSIVAAAAVVAIALWRWPSPGAPPSNQLACDATATGFAFEAFGNGHVACGGAERPRGVLPVGGVLDTGAHEAKLAIADIGSARLSAGTRVRLDRTSAERHQLFLERGKMHAKVNAPPRLFAVTTPGASVTDLGCEYTLEVDERGAGSIHVQTGKVEIEGGRGELVVMPAGTRARLLPGRRAGLPVVVDAPRALVEAADAFDSGAPDATARVLAAVRAEDAFTVVNLAMLVATDPVRAGERRTVLEKLATLFPPPTGVTVDTALADDRQLAAWHEQILSLLDTRMFFLDTTP